jgi:hypothetical protein
MADAGNLAASSGKLHKNNQATRYEPLAHSCWLVVEAATPALHLLLCLPHNIMLRQASQQRQS